MANAEFILCIDVASGTIVDCDSAACDLLGLAAQDICGAIWPDIFQCQPTAVILRHALCIGQWVALPPLLICLSSGDELAVGGQVAPYDASSVELRLWLLPGVQDAQLRPAVGDVVAVLGVDHLRYGADWNLDATARLMSGARNSLADIARAQDWVGAVGGTSVVLVLREVSREVAGDMSRALLSHLHRTLLGGYSGAVGARFALGLAQCSAGSSALATLVAANNALLLAQYTGGWRADTPFK